MASASGGMDIESVAEHAPEKILKLPVDPLWGLTDYKIRAMADFLGYEDRREFDGFVRKVWKLFREKDAVLVEINPLVVTDKGLLALDAKVEIDDDARPRLKELFEKKLAEQAALTGAEEEANHGTITYVPLEGNVGLISDGAGTGMLTLDLIRDLGGEAARHPVVAVRMLGGEIAIHQHELDAHGAQRVDLLRTGLLAQHHDAAQAVLDRHHRQAHRRAVVFDPRQLIGV